MSQTNTNLYLKAMSEWNFIEIFRFFGLPISGLYQGIRYRILPLNGLVFISCLIFCAHGIGLDILVFHSLKIMGWYPISVKARLSYLAVLLLLPFVIWGFIEGARLLRFKRSLEEILTTAGLKNPFGKTPQVLAMVPLDANTKKLILKKLSFSIKDFQNAKPRIESGLRGFVDEIRENRVRGTVDIIFSTLCMPTSIKYCSSGFSSDGFFVGATRASEVFGDLEKTPHLLVAGQTGGGKSTFLRSFITTLYLNSKDVRFTLIDLKGGLEFQIFEDLPRVEVLPNLNRAVESLHALHIELNRRVEILKMNKAKDLGELKGKKINRSIVNTRRVIIVDEAAELFLSGGGSDASKIIQARRILSQIARQGRAAGMNVVIATQRPDSRSLDPQVKANLPGVLCFPMQNDSSSITVLGNGRATDLPLIPGRAIWKEGPIMTEVQTPFLSIEEADRLLEPHRIGANQSESHQ